MRELALVAVGVLSGVLGPVGGVMSLVSFPALLLLGTPPLAANAANTIAVATPGAIGASIGYRRTLREQPPRLLAAMMACAAAAGAAGAILVLRMGEAAFTATVPVLLIGGSALILAQPWLMRLLARRRGGHPPPHPLLAVAVTIPVAVYGGYFGVGAGVVFLSAYLAVLTHDVHTANAVKSLVGATPNLLASAVFLLVWARGELPLDWSDITCLMIGSLAGGVLGVRVARLLPVAALRVSIACCGVAAALIALR